ncbi:MAG: ATP-binding cassette domain-containing protein, partial [Planctomycetota bacterium]|nr:ATP-binding cassette domain-containing protein [Planctomycetota bacterium]
MNNPESPPVPVLSAAGVFKSYRMGSSLLEVLRGVDIELHTGEVTALMGSSGSGKSTLLQLLGLMDRLDQGKIALRGRPIQKLGSGASAKIRATE